MNLYFFKSSFVKYIILKLIFEKRIELFKCSIQFNLRFEIWSQYLQTVVVAVHNSYFEGNLSYAMH